MSNTSIAAFRTDQANQAYDLLLREHSQWRIAVNQPKFDFEANVIICHNRQVALVWVRHPHIEASDLYQKLGHTLACWWIEVFFQEHVVWEYSFYHNTQLHHQFIPMPEMWDMTEAKLGDAQQLADVWKVKKQRLDRYLRRWDAKLKPRKAYFWSDRSRYKHPEQGFDFIHALTGLRFPD